MIHFELKIMRRLYNYIGILGIALLFAGACTEADKETFRGPESIYFRMPQGDTTLIIRKDTVIYSFAFDPVLTQREIYIPVEVIGFASSHDRTYTIKVANVKNTKSGVHYEAISEQQHFPAGKMLDSLKVVFNRTEDMQREACKIEIMIKAGGDFVQGITESLLVAIQVSDILEEPSWWEMWRPILGVYDHQIYRQWIKIWGGTGDLSGYTGTSWFEAPQVLTAIIDLKKFFEANSAYYSNDVRIIIPGPK